jgi:ATP-dependent Clp protease ATP-binding subunit ClpB
MTSNLGSHLIQSHTATDDYNQMKAAVMQEVGLHFRPELINRIDEVVVVHTLQKAEVAKIASIQLSHLEGRLAEKSLSLKVTGQAMSLLVDLGYEPAYGARPLKRSIQQWIENPLAKALLAGTYQSGDEIIVDAKEGAFNFS